MLKILKNHDCKFIITIKGIFVYNGNIDSAC